MLLKKGDEGDSVRALQTKLGIPADGNFGPATEASVKAFQTRCGLHADGIVGDKTWNAIMVGVLINQPMPIQRPSKYSKEKIEKAVKTKGYLWFEDKLNIVGVRNSDTGDDVTNQFDDKITISQKIGGEWKYYEWTNTTDPGKKAVLESKNSNGVARLVPGQYINSHIIRPHKGTYLALGQDKPVKVYRDANKDLTYDETRIQEGLFGINIHKAGVDSTYVEGWSEGCQVFKRATDFEKFMDICQHSNQTSFTYTLIESKDIQ